MTMHFHTDSVAVGERLAFWQEVVCNTFVELDCSFPSPGHFHGHLQTHAVGGLSVVEVGAAAQRVTRDARRIARSDDEYVLVSLALEGRARVMQEDREAALEVGDFAIYDTRRPYQLHFDGAFRQTVVQIPRARLQARLGHLEYLTALPMSRGNPLERLVFDLLGGLAGVEGRLAAPQQERLAEQSLDLLAMALGERSCGGLAQASRRSALLLRIKDHIQAHLGDSELDLASVSRKFAVSVRYISRLFQDDDTTFGRYLLHQRLQRCARDLRDPGQAMRQISELAYRWGFTDMAYFSRVFRARYAASAREYRADIATR
ncbi:helix-turn-helix domain-containing protein [Pseudomonas sp. nanlin1]|uniref:AraC-like ligand-binding domain-containing protein n=1 Tax=Pseudomonas sp. nanlin1 TaxID=3040605 RepID=UPI0038910A06